MIMVKERVGRVGEVGGSRGTQIEECSAPVRANGQSRGFVLTMQGGSISLESRICVILLL